MFRLQVLGCCICACYLAAAVSIGATGIVSPLDVIVREAGQYNAVPNGQEWNDTSGNVIRAFGGNYYQEDSVFYWIGQNVPSLSTQSSDDPAMINLYKSSDLLNWDKIGAIITVYTPNSDGDVTLTWCRLERPKLLKSKATGKYVVWAHYETGNSYSASEVIVFTADKIEGPYTVTKRSHHRPGAGSISASAMGDRVGGPRPDYSSKPLDSNNSSIAFAPVQPSYPPTILQYGSPTTAEPYNPAYLPASQYGTVSLTNVRFNVTMKAVAVKMTAWNATYYDKYVGSHSISPSTYITRYATDVRSNVSSRAIAIGNAGDGPPSSLDPPLISPTIEESSSEDVVFVNSGDSAFLTARGQETKIYYSTNGSDPVVHSSNEYIPGTRITVLGQPGSRLEVRALASYNGEHSEVASRVYEIASDPSSVPLFAPVFSFASGTYERNSYLFQSAAARVYSPTYMSNVYYTLDGIDPDPPGLGYNLGYGSRDMTVWKDPKSDQSYLVTATDNIHTRIWQLKDDLTEVDPELEYDVFVNESREAPTLVRHGGQTGKFVYLLTSTQTGWYPNQAQYVRTDDFEGGFSAPRDATSGYRNGRSHWSALSPVGDTTTYGSQPTWILNIGTDIQPTYVYIGDRHNPLDLIKSTHIMTPLYIDDDSVGQGGVEGAGNVTITFEPLPAVDVARGVIHPLESQLLSRGMPVLASPSKSLSDEQIQAGTYNFSAAVANDGVDFDVDPYDAVAQYYAPTTVPYFWQVDLGQVCDLSWAGLTFRKIPGSDSVSLYTISGRVDDDGTWTQLVDNTKDQLPGYKSHLLDGAYRYIRLDVNSVYDVVHNKSASSQAGLHEMSIYGNCI
ncbi:unnamed protein product [Clonostachys rosea]|uniref:F5/8 type C domain-containing protein n=1 Tax=Bionectria ochroleuca TaxID=29856 RepID=A0ABY6UTK8_BIOOC|nr:unnamed protein product [Clonostachys rosea]